MPAASLPPETSRPLCCPSRSAWKARQMLRVPRPLKALTESKPPPRLHCLPDQLACKCQRQHFSRISQRKWFITLKTTYTALVVDKLKKELIPVVGLDPCLLLAWRGNNWSAHHSAAGRCRRKDPSCHMSQHRLLQLQQQKLKQEAATTNHSKFKLRKLNNKSHWRKMFAVLSTR